MNKVFIGVGFILFYIISCQNVKDSGRNHRDGIENIIIDPQEMPKSNMMASTLIDSFIYIPLETKEHAIIGRIKSIYEWDHRFYIWDDQTATIFVFSDQGKFIKKIDRKGRGAEEYVNLHSFYLNSQNGDLYIHCDRSQSFLHYDYDGTFIERIPCKFITDDFTISGKDSLILYGGRFPNKEIFKTSNSKEYRYVVMKDGQMIEKDLPWEYQDAFLEETGKINYFFSFADTTSLIESFGNEIYRIGHHYKLIPRFYVDFGKYTYPLAFEMNLTEAQEIINTSKKDANRWCKILRIIEMENSLYMDYSLNNYIYNAIYSKATKTIYNIGPVWINDIDYIGMPNICNSNNNYLLGSIEAYSILQSKDTPKLSQRIKNIMENISEQDNPILVKMKLKKI